MDESVRDVPLTFRLGEITLGAVSRRMVVRSGDPFAGGACTPIADLEKEAEQLRDVHGVLYRSLRTESSERLLEMTWRWIRYVPRQYERFYVDLASSYETYLQSFSGKTRSNLRRKVRKFEKKSGGKIHWQCYRTVSEIEAFFPLARSVSAQSYQERLLGVGIPADEAFRQSLLTAAAADEVRGYIVFLDGKAVAYLYCPIRDGVVVYSNLGYLPEFSDLSPGTVLLWLAVEDLFTEGMHCVFDFTEGGQASEHSQKRLFSTGSVHCADIYVFRFGVVTAAIVLLHASTEWIVGGIGKVLDAVGLKHRIRKLVRWITTPSGAPSQ